MSGECKQDSAGEGLGLPLLQGEQQGDSSCGGAGIRNPQGLNAAVGSIQREHSDILVFSSILVFTVLWPGLNVFLCKFIFFINLGFFQGRGHVSFFSGGAVPGNLVGCIWRRQSRQGKC